MRKVWHYKKITDFAVRPVFNHWHRGLLAVKLSGKLFKFSKPSEPQITSQHGMGMIVSTKPPVSMGT